MANEFDINNSNEPEVVKSVLNELKTYGENSKKNYEELRKNHEELKYTVENGLKDTLSVEKFNKLAEDITTRQQALDEKQIKKEQEQKLAAERIDALEVAFKRPGRSNLKDTDELYKEAKEFKIAALSACRKNDSGVSFDEMEKLEKEQINIEDYKAYMKAFDAYVRRYGGARDYRMPDTQHKALQVGIEPDGGITVPTATSNRITQILYETDPIRQLSSTESITTGKIEWMAEWDQAGFEWEGEITGETTITGETSTPSWKKRSISVHTMAARPRATQTLLEDSGINIESWLANKIADRFSRGEAAAFVSGDGIGKPRGFLTYDNGTSFGQIEQVAMGAAAAITADGFARIKYSLKEQFLNRGTWLMNRSTVLAAMLLKDGTGNYIWKPGLTTDNAQSNILNLPVRMSTTMPEVAAGALSIALADWKQAYLIIDRLGITIQRDPYTQKPFVEFYTRKRVGGDVDNWEAIKLGVISA
jgi:HK97 family phage major capsid protein